MRRLVYAPHVQAFIKTSTDQVIDISPYLVSGSVDRKVNQVSSAQLTLRNPTVRDGAPGIITTKTHEEAANLLFTEFKHADGTIGPLFHPMDPIIIVMQRIQNYPIQMFTGYLDKAPYIQLYPGLCSIEASCTLKRLLYTQWDAALPFVMYFLEQYGWVLNAESGITNPPKELSRLKTEAGKLKGQFNDGSIGALLFAVLNHIGNWDKDSIFIEALPSQIKDIVLNLYQETSKEAQQGNQVFQSLITEILGKTGSLGGGAPGSSSTTSAGTGAIWEVQFSDEGKSGSGNGGNYSEAGWTELSTNPGCSGDTGSDPCDYSALGQQFPSVNRTLMNISGDKGKTWHTMPQLDVGGGSTGLTHNGFVAPAIGLTDNAEGVLGVAPSSTVYIQLHSGADLSIPAGFGKLVSPPTVSSKGQGNKSVQKHRFGQGVAGSPSPTPTHHTTMQRASTASVSGKSPGKKVGKAVGTQSAGANSTPNANSMINPIPGFTGLTFDDGIDAGGPAGAAVLAPANCSIAYFISGFYHGDQPDHSGGLLQLKFDQAAPGAPSQYWYISEHVVPVSITPGHKFNQGATVANFGGTGGGSGIEIGWGTSDQSNPRYAQTPAGIARFPGGATDQHYQTTHTGWGWDFYNYFSVGTGKAVLGRVSGGTSGSGGSSTSAVAAAFSTFINLPSTFSMAEALAFTGKRSFIADQPLFPFIEQLCQASLRNFMSMPNGNFFAFFPDYFGMFGRKYYWEIADIEIIDGRIDLTDDPLVTHVAVAGDVTQYHGQIDVFDLILTSGIFDIFDAFATNYIAGSAPTVTGQTVTTSKTKKKSGNTQSPAVPASTQDALAFLQRYGARPYVEEAPMIRSPFFELFLAFQRFMLLWAKQFVTTFELTFMPEVFPGGLIYLRDHGLQLYVEEVTHAFDYEHGFTTTIAVSSPSRPGTLIGKPTPAPTATSRATNPSSGPSILITPPQGNTNAGHR